MIAVFVRRNARWLLRPTVLLYTLFDTRYLVAEKFATGHFSPSLDEIKKGLNEPSPNDSDWDPEQVTFYGYTSSAISRYKELSKIYETTNDT